MQAQALTTVTRPETCPHSAARAAGMQQKMKRSRHARHIVPHRGRGTGVGRASAARTTRQPRT
eukprot:13428963-Alexandrium_andersonii.AAC.1